MTPEDAKALETFKQYLAGTMSYDERRTYENVYCHCPDCVQCGCNDWERHHIDLGEVSQ